MKKDVIIACDFGSAEDCYAFLNKFKNESRKPFLKIGMELYYSAGPEIVRKLKDEGYKIFLDLKLHDIPNTVKKAMKVLSGLSVDMVNVHAGGSIEMMRAAREGLTREDGTRPLLIAVTQLTSTSEKVMQEELLIGASINDTIIRYALNAREAGLDGVVCSPLEASVVKEACGNDFLTVTPGIRFADSSKDDQVRVTDPAQARALGSDFIVVGRPITAASDPVAAWKRCLAEFLDETIATQVARSLLRIKAVFLRPDEPFTWASGIKSPVYCDNRLILTSPNERAIVENAIAKTVEEKFPEAEVLMGTSTAGIAHAAIAGWLLNMPMGYVRGGNKDHGRGNRIEGELKPGQKVVVIEDLISTAGSCIEVVEALREAGADVLGVVSIFTYGMQKGIKRLEEARVVNYSLSDFKTLCRVAVEENYISAADEIKLKKFMSDPSDPSWRDA